MLIPCQRCIEKKVELVSELIANGVVTVNSDGDLTHIDSNSTIGLEPFLRTIFVKRASLRETGNFFRMIINHIPDDVIENQKLLELKSSVDENIQGVGFFLKECGVYSIKSNFIYKIMYVPTQHANTNTREYIIIKHSLNMLGRILLEMILSISSLSSQAQTTSEVILVLSYLEDSWEVIC